MVGPVLFGADELVAAFVCSRIPQVGERGFGPSTALGVVKDSKLLGGVVYHQFSGHDIQASYAFDSPRWATPGVLRTLFAYPFVQLKCVRMTALIPRKNKHAREMILRLGFKLEGVHPKAADGRQDAVSYGMLKTDCRWIKRNDDVVEMKADGQKSARPARVA